ncbi:glycoside hydrolase family 19 protein, partial [uncultured Gilliamella sp.]|uniref:glycoside hydrolase family 19 protein n=1 Tax=uncultured Gilliamella sp. TaxID=1193505 RepID=UPI0025DC3438
LTNLSSNGKVWFIHPVAIHIFDIKNCMCNKSITEDQFKSIMPNDILNNGLFYRMNNNLKNTAISIFLSSLNRNFIQYNITSCLQKAHFISQVLCESDFFRTSEEYKNKDGSTPSYWNNYKGGTNYHGRGLIQITHDYNYESFGKYVDNNLIKNNPDIICSDLEYTIRSAFWYWLKGSSWGNINDIAAQNDFLKITMAVNGGYNHVVERNTALITLYEKFNIENCVKYHDIRVDNFSFNTSAMINTKWYANNQKKAQEVETALQTFYTRLHNGT